MWGSGEEHAQGLGQHAESSSGPWSSDGLFEGSSASLLASRVIPEGT